MTNVKIIKKIVRLPKERKKNILWMKNYWQLPIISLDVIMERDLMCQIVGMQWMTLHYERVRRMHATSHYKFRMKNSS